MIRRVLFICTGTSARSQMAEALLRLIAGGRFEVCSAGTNSMGLNPYAITAMQEIEVDISRQRSKSVTEFIGQPFDVVITVCDRAKEACPVFPGVQHIQHWSFEDPATAPESERLAACCNIRDKVADAICRFLVEEGGLLPEE
ncbi:MAG: arsenate reductase ArsC [Nitrospirota bacterium]|nr:arsenate reductase ArsC [Nitrospirota bacterium]